MSATSGNFLGSLFRSLWTSYEPTVDDDDKRLLDQIKQAMLDRNAAIEALAISEERFRGAFETSAIGFALVGLTGKWLEVNRSLCEVLGYSREELLGGMSYQDVTYPADLATDNELYEDLKLGRRGHYQVLKRYITKGNDIIPVLLSVSLSKDKDGNPAFAVSQILDLKHISSLLERSDSVFRDRDGAYFG